MGFRVGYVCWFLDLFFEKDILTPLKYLSTMNQFLYTAQRLCPPRHNAPLDLHPGKIKSDTLHLISI